MWKLWQPTEYFNEKNCYSFSSGLLGILHRRHSSECVCLFVGLSDWFWSLCLGRHCRKSTGLKGTNPLISGFLEPLFPGLRSQQMIEMIIDYFCDKGKSGGNEQQVKIKSPNLGKDPWWLKRHNFSMELWHSYEGTPNVHIFLWPLESLPIRCLCCLCFKKTLHTKNYNRIFEVILIFLKYLFMIRN